ncbi:unnamed protein product [Angiostrongylus costaricensis]|uniref:Ovule protein n=1 Tax=Angiostrongylus costaricensis TaxID=334426 RepID=A0A0R3PI67_ANGCS|nr:unnamed protein product [Angiostrongylus costaricensis]
MEHESVKKEFSLTDQKTEDHQKPPCGSFIGEPVQRELVEKNIFDNNQSDEIYSEDHSIINEECPSSGLLNQSFAPHRSSVEVDSADADASGNGQNETFSVVQDDCNEKHGEGTSAFPSH